MNRRQTDSAAFDLQGHRGCRGLMAENTLPGFLKALELGVRTLELDVVISRDKKVVVSHEAFFSSTICLTPEGKELTRAQALLTNLYQMDYMHIAKWDCGSKKNPAFPNQQNFTAPKPLLQDLINEIENFKANCNEEIRLNVEIKSTPQGDFVNHPPPEEFSDLVLDLLAKNNYINKSIVQSFDFRILRYIHTQEPNLALSALFEPSFGFDEKKLLNLGFIPSYIGPHYTTNDAKLMKTAKAKGIKVLPWTVNEKEEMKKQIDLDVDGLITDYPDIALELLSEQTKSPLSIRQPHDLKK